MRKFILFLGLLALVSGCSFHVKNKNTMSYVYLMPKANVSFRKTLPSTYLGYIDSNTLNSNYILYEQNGYYNYYAYTKWLIPPTEILKNIIYTHINYIRSYPMADYRLKLILFNFEPHFDKDRFFYLRAKAFLYDKDFKLLKEKTFSIKTSIDKLTNHAMLKASDRAIDIFLTELDDFVSKSLKPIQK